MLWWRSARMSLSGEPILLIDAPGDTFTEQLRDALVTAEADVMVCPDEGQAVEHMRSYEFSAALLRGPLRFNKHLLDALGGAPLFYYSATPQQPGPCLPMDVPTILRELEKTLGASAT